MRSRLSPLAGRIAGGSDAPSLLRTDCFRAAGVVDRQQADQPPRGSPAPQLDGVGHPRRTGARTAPRKKSTVSPSGGFGNESAQGGALTRHPTRRGNPLLPSLVPDQNGSVNPG